MNKWELTVEEKNNLSDEDHLKYNTAVSYKKHEWANGPWGGWVRGNELLKELGWTEITRTAGHRKFVSLKKPILFRFYKNKIF